MSSKSGNTAKIKAKNLASGDTVYFPRLGALTILRIAGVTSWSISFICSDRKKHTLELEREVLAELATDAPLATIGEVIRHDLESNRVSMASPSSLYEFWDLREIPMPAGLIVTGTRESEIRAALSKGKIVRTSKAVYTMRLAGETNERAA